MEKINLIIGDNFDDINRAVVAKINPLDFRKKNIVITPDRFSLLCENLILDTLNISSYFNIEVMGISGFANLIFKKLNLDFDYLNKFESKLLIRKAVLNAKENLKCFVGDVTTGVVDLIFNAISIFRSNEVTPEDIFQNFDSQSTILKNKLSDISLIYKEYIRLLNNKLDSTEILNILNLYLEKIDLKNYNFYFVNFDSFTKQGFAILQNLCKTVNQIFVGAIKKPLEQNFFIYEEDVFSKLSELSKTNKICLTIQEVKNTLKSEQKILHKNLFSLSPEKFLSENISVLECGNRYAEVLDIAKTIKKMIVEDNLHYKDFSVACGDLKSYEKLIENIFSEFNFSFYLDTEQNIYDNQVVQFIFNIFECLKENVDIEIIKKIIISDLCDLGKEEKNQLILFIEKYDIKSNIIYDNFKNEKINEIKNKIFNKIIELKLENNNKVNDFNNIFNKIIKDFNLQEKIALKINLFKNKNYLAEEKKYIQLFPKMQDSLESLQKILGDEELLLEEYLELLKASFSEQKISSVPLSTDSIFVGDATDSFFEKRKILFVVGANENLLPRVTSDTSIINDDVIEKISESVTLTPTVRMINRRSKFKLFNLLKNFQEKLFVSFSTIGEDGKKLLPSGFVEDLRKIFSLKINLKNLSKDNLPLSFAKNTGIKKYAMLEFYNNIQNRPFENSEFYSSLCEIISSSNKNETKLFEQKIDDKDKLFFENNRTKISQIEKFYECPFKHFVLYGLKLKDKELAELNSADIGQFLHKIAEEFLNKNNNYIELINNNLISINKIIEKIIKKLENNIVFYKFYLNLNKISLNIVKDESVRFCQYLYDTQKISKFETQFLEVYFGKKDDELDLKVLDRTFKIVGVVDRVDVCGDKFIVIDYKSGTTTKGNNQELFYGDKLQIFVYARAVEKLLGKVPCGLYYFPISNAYADDNIKNPYFLKGKSLQDDNFLQAMDLSLNFEKPKSEIFTCDISVSKKNIENGIIEYLKKPNNVTREELDAMIDYAMEMMKNGIAEILGGSMEISPRVNACNYCPYKSLCHKSDILQERKNIYEVKNKTFSICLEKLKGGKNEY